MAVNRLISRAELLLLRPPQVVSPATAPSVPQTTPVRARETQQPTPPTTRPFTPAQERRQRVEAIARQNERRVENEVVLEMNDRLSEVRATLERIVELTTRAQNNGLNDQERTELLRQARELAGQTENAIPPRDPFQRPEVATLATIALRPEVLALADAARSPRDLDSDATEIRTRAIALQNRIDQVRRDILRPEERRPEYVEQQTENVREERARIESPAEATRVTQQIRAESRVQSGDLFLMLTNVLPQNALSLLMAT